MSMNRLDPLSGRERPLLACLFQPGDPRLPGAILDVYAEHGVDILEVSLPHKSPRLDGRVVAGSMRRALASGMTPRKISEALRRVRRDYRQLAIVLMGYQNLDSVSLCEGGKPLVDGVLRIGNGAPRHSSRLALSRSDIRRVGFVSAAILPAEVRAARTAGGYVMLQAAAGKTGMRRRFDASNSDRIMKLRDAGVTMPILLGIGISRPGHARRAVRAGAQGVIVGSACIVHAQAGMHRLARFVKDMRAALDDT